VFQKFRIHGASPKVFSRDGNPGHAVRGKEWRATVRRDWYDRNRYDLRPLRAHTGAYVSCALPAHQDAADVIRRDCVCSLPLWTEAAQALGQQQQDIREYGAVRDIRGRIVRLHRIYF